MAQLFDARFRALDANGDPLAGATLTIYTANTVTPAAIFRDAALAVPMSNPTSDPSDVSDAGGWFPQVFAAEGTVVDILLKTTADVLVKSYADFTFVGADTGDFTRALADGTRLKITGSGGRALIQAGDPSPDNIGGKLSIEGWAGTQLDDLLLGAALTDTTGAIKEKGKKLPGVVYTEATTFTGVSEVLIALPNDPVGTRAWQVDLFDLFQSGAVDIRAQMSVDGGATYLSGASDYSCATVMTNHSAQTCNALAVVDTSYWLLGYDFVGLTNRPGGGTLQIITPRSGSFGTRVTSKFDGFFSATDWRTYSSHMMTKASFGSVDHIRIFPTSGTITGKYRVVPLRGYGES